MKFVLSGVAAASLLLGATALHAADTAPAAPSTALGATNTVPDQPTQSLQSTPDAGAPVGIPRNHDRSVDGLGSMSGDAPAQQELSASPTTPGMPSYNPSGEAPVTGSQSQAPTPDAAGSSAGAGSSSTSGGG